MLDDMPEPIMVVPLLDIDVVVSEDGLLGPEPGGHFIPLRQRAGSLLVPGRLKRAPPASAHPLTKPAAASGTGAASAPSRG